jgi:hypothetical protein
MVLRSRHFSGLLVRISIIALLVIAVCSNPAPHLDLRNCGYPEELGSNFSMWGPILLETPDNLTIGWGDAGYVLKWRVNSSDLTTYCQYFVRHNENLIDSGYLPFGLAEINVTVGWLEVGTHTFTLFLDWHEGTVHMGMGHQVYVTVSASLLLYATYSIFGGSVVIFALILLKRRISSYKSNV